MTDFTPTIHVVLNFPQIYTYFIFFNITFFPKMINMYTCAHKHTLSLVASLAFSPVGMQVSRWQVGTFSY